MTLIKIKFKEIRIIKQKLQKKRRFQKNNWIIIAMMILF